MLTPVDDTLAIVACTTCRFSAAAREDGDGIRGGAVLVAELHAAKAADPRYAGVAIGCIGGAVGEVERDHLRLPRQDLGAQRAADVDQIGLRIALAWQEDQVGGVHRGDRGAREVVGVAGADADEVEIDHSASISGP